MFQTAIVHCFCICWCYFRDIVNQHFIPHAIMAPGHTVAMFINISAKYR